jgi:hypothetical protein
MVENTITVMLVLFRHYCKKDYRYRYLNRNNKNENVRQKDTGKSRNPYVIPCFGSALTLRGFGTSIENEC